MPETNFAPRLGEIFEATDGPVEVFDFNGVPSGAAPEGAFGIDTSNGDFYQVTNGSWIFLFSTGGGVGAVQTPWAQNINGGGFNLSNVGTITATSLTGIGAVKIYPDGATLRLATPEYAGQISIALDGLFSIPRTANAANHTDDIIFEAAALYFRSLQKIGSGTINCGAITSDDAFGIGNVFTCSGAAYVDNVFDVRNTTGGFSAATFRGPADPSSISAITIGHAPAAAGGAPYEGHTYIETNSGSAGFLLDHAPDLIVSQYENSASAGLFNHVRAKFDAVNQKTMFYGWTNGAQFGPTALTVEPTGALTVGVGMTSTGLLTVTQATANTGILASTGYSLTGSNATSMLDLAGTWNTSGNPVALKLAISNTASGATSKFLSFLAGAAGATEVLSVDKAGFLTIGNSVMTATTFRIGSGPQISASGFDMVSFGLSRTLQIAFGASSDTILVPDAANTLALRNSTNAQSFNVYETYTDASNYDRVRFGFASNIFFIQSEKAGTGVVRPLQISAGSSTINVDADSAINFRTSVGTVRWAINSSGHLLAGTDNSYDIGASGATRPRNAYVAGFVLAPTLIAASGGLVGFQALTKFTTTTDGILMVANNALNDFSRLQFGGTTDSFGAIGRDGAGIKIVGAANGSTAWIKVPAVAVASLPSAATAGDGARAYVTDAVSQVFGATVTGGGAVPSPVYSDGSVWRTG